MRIAMMAITTSNSIRVNPWRQDRAKAARSGNDRRMELTPGNEAHKLSIRFRVGLLGQFEVVRPSGGALDDLDLQWRGFGPRVPARHERPWHGSLMERLARCRRSRLHFGGGNDDLVPAR